MSFKIDLFKTQSLSCKIEIYDCSICFLFLRLLGLVFQTATHTCLYFKSPGIPFTVCLLRSFTTAHLIHLPLLQLSTTGSLPYTSIGKGACSHAFPALSSSPLLSGSSYSLPSACVFSMCVQTLPHYLQQLLHLLTVTSTLRPTLVCQVSCPCSVSIFKDPLVLFRGKTNCLIFY